MNWNEIQNRAGEFAAHWQGEEYEKGESQTLWGQFLTVFGIDRRRQGALFEFSTKKVSGERGFVDLFWPGKLVAEHKSLGRDRRPIHPRLRPALEGRPARRCLR